MSCKYHPSLNKIGNCVDCGADYCKECEVPITRHGNICLDCGVKFAWKKILISIAFAITGLIMGLNASGPGEGITFAYIMWAGFFGYHYGGFWKKIGDFFGDSVAAGVILLAVRMIVSLFLGALGGGIIQFISYLKIIKKKGQLQALQTA